MHACRQAGKAFQPSNHSPTCIQTTHHPPSTHHRDVGPGVLLLAHPMMEGDCFQRSAVYLIEHRCVDRIDVHTPGVLCHHVTS